MNKNDNVLNEALGIDNSLDISKSQEVAEILNEVEVISGEVDNKEKEPEGLTEEQFKELKKINLLSKQLTYRPRKEYGVQFKNERRKKNKQSKKMRKVNSKK